MIFPVWFLAWCFAAYDKPLWQILVASGLSYLVLIALIALLPAKCTGAQL